MKVSIIVPVYKVEKYLERCLASIIKQTYKNIEIILVDDESPDNCPTLCEQWSEKDDRIKVIHKKNGGLGLARNSGIEIATGDYIAFVDSDDYIDEDAIEKAIERIVESNFPDVCLFGRNTVYENGCIQRGKSQGSAIYTGASIREELLPRAFSISLRRPKDSYGIGPAWGGVYRMAFLNEHSIRFVSERQFLCEDLLFSIEVCLHAERIVYLDRCLYYYCENSASLTHSYRRDRFEKACALYTHMISIIESQGLNNDARLRACDGYLINIIVCLKQEINRRNTNYLIKRQQVSRIGEHAITRRVLRHYPLSKMPIQLSIMFFLIKFSMYDIVYLVIAIHEHRREGKYHDKNKA